MRILFVMPRFHTNLISWVQALQSHGHTVAMFVLFKGATEDYSVIVPNIFGLSIISKVIKKILPYTEDVSSQLAYGIPPIIKFIREFRRENPDIVIVRSPNSPFGLFSCILGLFLGKRIIIYTQGAKYFSSLTIARKLFYFIFIQLFQAVWMTPVLGNDTDKLNTFSKLEYIPFTVDVPVINDYIRENLIPVKILSVGKYELRKNHHLLIKAISALAKKYPVQLTIAGECSRDSHRDYLNFLNIKVKEYGLSDIVTLKVNMPYHEMQSLYSQHHLFVLPSTRECASIANLEAMGYGLPVICSDTNGTACYTIHGITGFLFKDNSYEDLFENLKSAVSDPNLIKRLSMNVKNEVQREYTSEQFYRRFTIMLRKHFGIGLPLMDKKIDKTDFI